MAAWERLSCPVTRSDVTVTEKLSRLPRGSREVARIGSPGERHVGSLLCEHGGRRRNELKSLPASYQLSSEATVIMNNPRSTALGWGSLVAAAGVSYYFAKKGINERRAEQDAAGTRPSEKLDWRAKIEKDEFQGAPKEKFEQAKDKTNSAAVGKVNHATGNPTLEETPGKTQG